MFSVRAADMASAENSPRLAQTGNRIKLRYISRRKCSERQMAYCCGENKEPLGNKGFNAMSGRRNYFSKVATCSELCSELFPFAQDMPPYCLFKRLPFSFAVCAVFAFKCNNCHSGGFLKRHFLRLVLPYAIENLLLPH